MLYLSSQTPMLCAGGYPSLSSRLAAVTRKTMTFPKRFMRLSPKYRFCNIAANGGPLAFGYSAPRQHGPAT